MKRFIMILLALSLLTVPVTALAAEGDCAGGHSYGQWVNVDAEQHTQTCTVCGDVKTAVHRWDRGFVSTQASCKDPGVRTHTCTQCGATKEVEVPKWTAHTYTYQCDPTCNICGERRYTTHGESTNWFVGETTHWRLCVICEAELETEAHTGTDSCRICGYKAPTEPTEAPTKAPTEAPTEATVAPTEAPTEPTEAPVVTTPTGSNALVWVVILAAVLLTVCAIAVVLYKKKSK